MKHADVFQDSYVEFMNEKYYVLFIGHEAQPIVITKPVNKNMSPTTIQPDGWPVYDRALIELVKAAEIEPWQSSYSGMADMTGLYNSPMNMYYPGDWDDEEEEEEELPPDERRGCRCDIKQLLTPIEMGGGHSKYCPWHDKGYKKKDIIE